MSVVRAVAVLAVVSSMLAWHATAASAHPLHTSLAQLTYDAGRRELTVSLRLFADDFGAAVARSAGVPVVAGQPVPDAAMYRYVAARFALAGARGETIPLAWCGARRTGEMLFVCLRAPMPAVPNGIRLRDAILVEAFEDQVNIVQYAFQGARQTTLFTKGDGAKPLR